MTDWQPIETAPRDVREVYDTPMPRDCYVLLGFNPDDVSGSDLGILLGYWDAYYAKGGAGYYKGCSGWVLEGAGETTDLHYGTPTHWMPLPPAPGVQP